MVFIIIFLNPTVYLVLYHLNFKKCDIKITFKFVICNLNHEIDSFEMERVLINQNKILIVKVNIINLLKEV